jgi:HlyD family secretion protein
MKKILGLAFCCFCVFSCGKKKDDPASLIERFSVDTVSLRDVISQTGEVRSTVKVDLRCEASGRIESLYVKEGQLLSRGQRILRIDPERLETRKKALELDLEQSRITMEMAKRDYDQALAIAGLGSVSQKQIDDFKSQWDLKTIAYKQQELDLEDIQTQLGQTIVTSPMNGVLTTLNVKEGEIAVSATGGFSNPTTVGTIVDVNKLEVLTQIGEVDYVHLTVGQTVVIKPEAVENAQTRGSISFVALTAKKENGSELGSFDVLVSIDSIIRGIAPGINVNVEFVILDKPAVLGVPFHYVKKEGDRATVDVAIKDKAGKERFETRKVATGATDYKNWEIVSGLARGEVAVFRPDAEAGNAAKKSKTPRAGFGKVRG